MPSYLLLNFLSSLNMDKLIKEGNKVQQIVGAPLAYFFTPPIFCFFFTQATDPPNCVSEMLSAAFLDFSGPTKRIRFLSSHMLKAVRTLR